jgi:hypothetical protein
MKIALPSSLILLALGMLLGSCAAYFPDRNASASSRSGEAASETTYVVQLTDRNFAEKVERSPGLKVVYFSNIFNPGYTEYGLIFDDIVKHYDGEVMIGQLNTQFSISARRKYSNLFQRYPAFVFFRDGVPIYWTSRQMTEPYLLATIDRLLEEDGPEESASLKQ